MGRQRRDKNNPSASIRPEPTPVPSRRDFLKICWTAAGGIAALEGAWVIGDVATGGTPSTKDESQNRNIVVAGPSEQFEPGSVTAFPEGRFYLVRRSDGGFLALSRACTHLGCTVPWDKTKKRFICPCHSSVFDINGDVLSAPAPRPLDTYAVRIENRIVKVDIGTLSKRERVDKNEAQYS